MRRSDGVKGSRAGTALAAATVLGVQPLRPSLLDVLCVCARGEARDAAARHSRGDDPGPDRTGSGRHGAKHLTAMDTIHILQPLDDEPDDEDLDEEDEESEEDEEDEDDEEVWQVRLT